MFAKASVLLALATSVAAHMRLADPVPFGVGVVSNSPLAPADYPCKRNYQVSQMNQWDAGETRNISFRGSAVHGGGSCQFSITTDTEPTEASQWKVIHSVVGGCPANVPGNIEIPGKKDGDPEALVADEFPVTMPDSIPDGQYTFAWTWFNKVGNREFYMDCAPVKVGSGGNAKRSSAAAALGSLPDMFIANLPETECTTKETEDLVFPNPGDSVYTVPGAALGHSIDGVGCAAQAKMAAGNGQLGEPSTPTEPGSGDKPAPSKPAASEPAASEPAASEPAATKTAGVYPTGAPAAPTGAPSYPTGVPSNPDGGVLAPGASPAPSASPAPIASPAPEVPAPKPEQPGNQTAPAAPSTPSSPDCTPCTQDGAVVCIGSNQFGLCNRGCAVAQDLAMGTVCTNGVIGAKRSIRNFPRAHLHRRHGSGSRLL